MRNEQNAVARGDAQQRDEPDDGRNAHFARSEPQARNAADQGQRQVQQDDAGDLQAAEFLIQQQENDEQRDERRQRQRA